MSLRLEIVPEKAIVIRRDRRTVAASWFGPGVLRPFIYPFVGPGGLELTRLGHPGDPVGHSHHRSIWIAHHDVDGIDYWSERRGAGRIIQTDVSEVTKEGPSVAATLALSWQNAEGREVLQESRRLRFHDLRGEELALDLELRWRAPAKKAVTLGKNNFGPLGLRLARTMRVEEGLGGRILNSGEAENEAFCFGQHATWVGASGPVARPRRKSEPRVEQGLPFETLGLACFDHPDNTGDATRWHVRDDGWFGPSLTRDAPRTIEPGEELRLRYHILAHARHSDEARIADRYRAWRRANKSSKKN